MADQANQAAGNPVGHVEQAQNEVVAINKSGTQRTLTDNAPVFAGDTIRTGNESSVVVMLDNGNRFDLGRNGEAVLDSDVLQKIVVVDFHKFWVDHKGCQEVIL